MSCASVTRAERKVIALAKSKKKNNKKKNPNPRPQQNIQSAQASPAEPERKAMPARQQSASDKPLFMRIAMLTIAVVMLLGLVIGTVAGAAGF